MWAGYDFSVSDKVTLEVTPMLRAVFGNTTGIAPGCNIVISYKRLELSAQSEYAFNTKDQLASFFYTWDEFTNSRIRRPIGSTLVSSRRGQGPTTPLSTCSADFRLDHSQENGFHNLRVQRRLDRADGSSGP